MSGALKMTDISERGTKSVITVCLSPGFGQSTGQITAQVLMKNRELPTPQMLVDASWQFLSGWYAISGALKRTGISERHRRCFYCWFINWLWPGNQKAKSWPRCWCRTGNCWSQHCHDCSTRPKGSMHPWSHAYLGESCWSWCHHTYVYTHIHK